MVKDRGSYELPDRHPDRTAAARRLALEIRPGVTRTAGYARDLVRLLR